MRWRASATRSLTAACASSTLSRSGAIDLSLRVDAGADGLTEDDSLDVPFGEEIEHDDGHPVVHAQRDCGAVHDGETAVEHIEVRQVRQPRRVRVLQRIRRVDAVALGGLE